MGSDTVDHIHMPGAVGLRGRDGWRRLRAITTVEPLTRTAGPSCEHSHVRSLFASQASPLCGDEVDWGLAAVQIVPAADGRLAGVYMTLKHAPALTLPSPFLVSAGMPGKTETPEFYCLRRAAVVFA